MEKLRIVTLRFGTGRQKWSLSEGQIPNTRVVRSHLSTGYNPGMGNRRAWRNGRVSSSPPEIPHVAIRTLSSLYGTRQAGSHSTRTDRAACSNTRMAACSSKTEASAACDAKVAAAPAATTADNSAERLLPPAASGDSHVSVRAAIPSTPPSQLSVVLGS
jgi:hypothetical protein